MTQFDVYENANDETAGTVPYLLDVQTDLLDSLSTRVVVPLVTSSVIGKPVRHLRSFAALASQYTRTNGTKQRQARLTCSSVSEFCPLQSCRNFPMARPEHARS